MAKFAYLFPGGAGLKPVDAASLNIHDRRVYYCTTPGCRAKMFARSVQTKSATFVTYKNEKHTGGSLCRIKDSFAPDHYDESAFNLDKFFNLTLGNTAGPNDVIPRRGSGGKGSHKAIPIHTLRTLYLMCVQFRVAGVYNGYKIDEILVDKYSPLSSYPIRGKRIVACTFFSYEKDQKIIKMNSPSDKREEWLELSFIDKSVYFNLRQKIFDFSHKKLVVIAGLWEPSHIPGCTARCVITSIGKQICRGDE